MGQAGKHVLETQGKTVIFRAIEPTMVGNEVRKKRHGLRLNIKTAFPMYGDSDVKDKTVARPSYL